MAKIPCFLCSKELQKRTDKNTKPYFVCDPCGMQIFIRGKEGIENLGELIVTLRKRDLPFREHAVVLYEIQALLTEMRGIKKEIKSIKDEFAPFESERDVADKERTLKLLNARIDNLLFQLDRIASRRA